MKKFFYSHPDTIIAALALILLGILAAFYVWASDDIYAEIYRALTYSPTQSSDSFDLTGAAKLDLRGLATSSITQAAAAVSTTTVAATTATTTAAGASTTAR